MAASVQDQALVAGSKLHRLCFKAMGCGMSLWLAGCEPAVAYPHLQAARLSIELAENELSRFRPASGLSRMNRLSGQPVPVSPILWEVMSAALEAAKATHGLYDPTVLRALESAGYKTSFETLKGQQAGQKGPGEGTYNYSWKDILLDPVARTVTIPVEAGIDLGGIAKGWTARQVAQSLGEAGPCLVDAGGDIAARGAPPGMAGWPVGVANPLQPELNLTVLTVCDGGMATSGIDYRRWTSNGHLQHHIIDPRTGSPARTDLLAVTVMAQDVVHAEIHAKAALILGASAGWDYLSGLDGVEGVLMLQDGSNVITPGLEHYIWKDA